MSEIIDSVSRISQIMAAKRAIETERSDRLFIDSFASVLAGSELNLLKQRLQDQDGSEIQKENLLKTRFVAVRTCFFDNFLISKNKQLNQIVILGAGMDTRAFRLEWTPETHLYEIDQADVIKRKNDLLTNASPKCYRHTIAVDLSQSWSSELLKQGYKTNIPTLWLMEGLLMYLDELAVNNLLNTISALSLGRSWLGADLISVKSLELAMSSNGKVRKYWRFGTDYPQQLFANYGWTTKIIQPGDEEANFGRYPKKLPPLEIPNLRRLFLIRASR
jgi:methyltransferase (TIGR00027 family)